MRQSTVNEAGNDGVSITIALPDCARHLARLRPAYSQGVQHHISNLIQQLRNYEFNRDALRPAILRTIERIERHQ